MACSACTLPADGAHLCPPCLTHLARTVKALPVQYAALAGHLPPARRPSAGRPTARPHAPLPAQLEALSLRAVGGIPTALTYWSNAVVRARHMPMPPRDRTTPLLAHHAHVLARHLPWCAVHFPDVVSLWGDLDALRVRAEHVLNPSEEIRTGLRCPVINEATGRPCTGPLSADVDSHVIRCSSCKTVWTGEQWLLLGRVLAT